MLFINNHKPTINIFPKRHNVSIKKIFTIKDTLGLLTQLLEKVRGIDLKFDYLLICTFFNNKYLS